MDYRILCSCTEFFYADNIQIEYTTGPAVKLLFDNSTSSNLQDFPVLVKLDSSRVDYSQTQDNGEDLRFYDADGTLLSHEIETWNESGDSFVWVKVPTGRCQFHH